MDTALVLDIAKFSLQVGLPAVKQIMGGFNKTEITREDWTALTLKWDKTLDDRLEEKGINPENYFKKEDEPE